MYYIYMLRCEDNSIYTGIAKDLEHRLNEHFTKDEKCAKYTKSHKAQKLEIAWKTQNKSLASKLEYAIKKLNKNKKEKLICEPNLLGEFFKEKIDKNEYLLYKIK